MRAGGEAESYNSGLIQLRVGIDGVRAVDEAEGLDGGQIKRRVGVDGMRPN